MKERVTANSKRQLRAKQRLVRQRRKETAETNRNLNLMMLAARQLRGPDELKEILDADDRLTPEQRGAIMEVMLPMFPKTEPEKQTSLILTDADTKVN